MLKKEKLKLISTLETIPDLLIVTRLSDGKIEFTNNKFIQSMKYSIEDIKATYEVLLAQIEKYQEPVVQLPYTLDVF